MTTVGTPGAGSSLRELTKNLYLSLLPGSFQDPQITQRFTRKEQNLVFYCHGTVNEILWYQEKFT